jgi:hypothetical protein
MDISADLVVTTTVSTGDVLVAATESGKYVTATAGDTGYGFGLHVKEKTTFGGAGYTALVVTR